MFFAFSLFLYIYICKTPVSPTHLSIHILCCNSFNKYSPFFYILKKRRNCVVLTQASNSKNMIAVRHIALGKISNVIVSSEQASDSSSQIRGSCVNETGKKISKLVQPRTFCDNSSKVQHGRRSSILKIIHGQKFFHLSSCPCYFCIFHNVQDQNISTYRQILLKYFLATTDNCIATYRIPSGF